MSGPTEDRVREILVECGADPFQNLKGTYSTSPSEVVALARSWLRQRERIAALEKAVETMKTGLLAHADARIDAIARDYYGLDTQQGLYEREIKRIAAASLAEHAKFYDRVPESYDTALRRIDAEVARCYGIEHP